MKGTATWLEKANKHLQKVLSQNALPGTLGEMLEKVQPEFDSLVNALGHTRELLHSMATFEPRTQITPQGDVQVATYRFPEGKVPEALRQQAEVLKAGFSKCSSIPGKSSF